MTHEYDHSSDTGHRDRHPSFDSTLNACWRGVRGLGALMPELVSSPGRSANKAIREAVQAA